MIESENMNEKFYQFEKNMFVFHCPACECLHHINTDPAQKPVWTFNNDLINPTVSPSILLKNDNRNFICHFFVKNGKIEFCADSTHSLSGQTVDLPLWKE